MSRDSMHNGGAYCRTERVLGNTTAETETDGDWIDRKDPNDKGIALSAKLVINYTAVLIDGGTLDLAVTFRDATSLAGAGADDLWTMSSTTVDTANSGGETVKGTAEIDVDLAEANQFVQAQITLAASGGGTVAYSASLVLFGDHRQPSTKALATLGGATSI